MKTLKEFTALNEANEIKGTHWDDITSDVDDNYNHFEVFLKANKAILSDNDSILGTIYEVYGDKKVNKGFYQQIYLSGDGKIYGSPRSVSDVKSVYDLIKKNKRK